MEQMNEEDGDADALRVAEKQGDKTRGSETRARQQKQNEIIYGRGWGDQALGL